jgi:hypothetical protein
VGHKEFGSLLITNCTGTVLSATEPLLPMSRSESTHWPLASNNGSIYSPDTEKSYKAANLKKVMEKNADNSN